MIIGVSRRQMIRRGKLSLKLLLTALLLFYLLSRLLMVLWDWDPKFHEKTSPDKPLQVISQLFYATNS